MFRESTLHQIKESESKPHVVKNCFSLAEIEKLLSIERNASYFVDRADGRKASIGNTGSAPIRQLNEWNNVVKDIIYPKH